MSGEEENDIPASGAVFTFGKSRFADNVPSHFFIRNDPVIDIDCGDEHTAIVCQNGRVFAFGNNEWGQLGLGHKSVVSKPSCLKSLKPEHAVHVACGKTHTLISTASGKLFACGNNSDGQLGVGDTTDRDMPTETGSIPGTIVQLSAGCLHSAALNSRGEVYVWGSNSDGQLGLGEDVKSVSTPTRLELQENIAKIACGYYHSVFVTEEGQVLVCGEGECGKLGLGTIENTYVPTVVSLEAWIMFVAAGGNHTIAVAVDGNVFGWGSNYNGQLGLLHIPEKDVLVPALIDRLIGTVIKQVSCGERHTAFITENAELLTCGESRHGKLGYEVTDTPDATYSIMPSRVSRFKSFSVLKVACGGCHTMVIASTRSNNDNEYLTKIPNGHVSPSKTLRLPEPEIVSPPVSGRTTLPPLQRVHVPVSNTAEPHTDTHNDFLQTEIQNQSPKLDNVHKPMIITSHDNNQNSNNSIDKKVNSETGSLNSPVKNANSIDESGFETISLDASAKLISPEGTAENVSSENFKLNNKKYLQGRKIFKMLQNILKVVCSKYSNTSNLILFKPLKEFSPVRCKNLKCSRNYLMITQHNECNLKWTLNETRKVVAVEENNYNLNDIKCDSEIISTLHKKKNNIHISNETKHKISRLRKGKITKSRHCGNNSLRRSVSLENIWSVSDYNQNHTEFNKSNIITKEILKEEHFFIKHCEKMTSNGYINSIHNKSYMTEAVNALVHTNNQKKPEKKNRSSYNLVKKSHSESSVNKPYQEKLKNIKGYGSFNCCIKKEPVNMCINYETCSNCKNTQEHDTCHKKTDETARSLSISNPSQSELDGVNCKSSLQNFDIFLNYGERSYPCFSCEDDTISVSSEISDNEKTNHVYCSHIEMKRNECQNSPISSNMYLYEPNNVMICDLQSVNKNVLFNNYINSMEHPNCGQQYIAHSLSKNEYPNAMESFCNQSELEDQKNYYSSMPDNHISKISNTNNGERCTSTHGINSKVNNIFTFGIKDVESYSKQNMFVNVNYVSDTDSTSEEDNEDVVTNFNCSISHKDLMENNDGQQKLETSYTKYPGFVYSSKVRNLCNQKQRENVLKSTNFHLITGGRLRGGEDCEYLYEKRNLFNENTKLKTPTLAEGSFFNRTKFNEDTGNRNNSPPIEIHQQDPEINGSEILEKNENGDSRNQVGSGGSRLTKFLTNMRPRRSQSDVDAPYDKHQNEVTENSSEMPGSNTSPATVSNNKKSKMCTIL